MSGVHREESLTEGGNPAVYCPSEYKTGGLRETEGRMSGQESYACKTFVFFTVIEELLYFQRKKIIHLKQAVIGHGSNLQHLDLVLLAC